MKKLSKILACIVVIAAMSGCNGSNQPANSNTSTSATEAPPTSTTTTTTSADTSASDKSSPDINVVYPEAKTDNEEHYTFLAQRVETFKESAPHFYDFASYFDRSKATIKFDDLDANLNPVLKTVFYIDTQYGLRVTGNTGETGTDEDIIDHMTYLHHHILFNYKEKKAYIADLYTENAIALNEDIRKTHLGYFFNNHEKINVETGEEEIGGVVYGFERLAGEEGNTSTYYYDKETGRVTYMNANGSLIRIVDYVDTVPDDAMNIPDGFETINITQDE